MKKIMIIILSFVMLFPNMVMGLSLSCRSCVLMDSDSGRVLYEKDKDNPRLIASITKIMTAILAIESNRLEEEVVVGEEVLTMYGSNIYIELGEKMKLLDLVYGLMLRSGNDAAIVIATFIGGTEEKFVKMMNEKAKELGCNKIALGHHFDDVIETTLLSMFYGSEIKTMMPKLHSDNFEGIELIRPLYLVKEEDIISWRNHNELTFINCACRFTEGCSLINDGTSKRKEMKELIKNLRKTNKEVDHNIFKSLDNVNLNCVLGTKKDGNYESFLDHYD